MTIWGPFPIDNQIQQCYNKLMITINYLRFIMTDYSSYSTEELQQLLCSHVHQYTVLCNQSALYSAM